MKQWANAAKVILGFYSTKPVPQNAAGWKRKFKKISKPILKYPFPLATWLCLSYLDDILFSFD